ncbi:MAG: DUF4215 domain-containing protein [Myxococcales bacterium]|nr:DUF4215 domain-containing protein [Myxococcales bacterium]
MDIRGILRLSACVVVLSAVSAGCGGGDPAPVRDMGMGSDAGDAATPPRDLGPDLGPVDGGGDAGLMVDPGCGNGVVEPDAADGGLEEQCDDDNNVNGDGCNAQCQLEPGGVCPPMGGACTRCGNNVIEAGEVCDDGNLLSRDGCSPTCQVEPGAVCPTTPGACTVCGNQIVNSDSTLNPEMCDDGMRCDDGTQCVPTSACDDGSTCSPRDGDGCSATCQVETNGWTCPVAGGQCFRCGDGMKQPAEQCDHGGRCGGTLAGELCVLGDANACGGVPADCIVIGGDGCNATCSGVEAFWACATSPTTGGSVCEQCGNGVVAGSETCDDGTNCLDGSDCTVGGAACGDGSTCQPRGGDGCRSVCLSENGWACPAAGGACERCGDGVIAPGFEDCDDGNTQANDGCSSSCRVELGWDCNANMSGVSVCGRCGDGAIQTATGEECDDRGRCANTNTVCQVGDPTACGGVPADCTARAGDGCGTDCRLELGWQCVQRIGGTICNRCGDGMLQGEEVCDNGARCTNDNSVCTVGDVNGCGGVPTNCQPVSGDGCNDQCRLETNYRCTSDVPAQCFLCGDGQLDPTEVCDDGNNMNGDGCNATCTAFTTGYTCLTEADGVTHATCVRCGDGVVQRSASGVGESCDDRNTVATDGCDMCQVDTAGGWTCTQTNQGGVLLHGGCANCGNGRIEVGEMCDDGVEPPAPGDGCSATCQVESGGWSCTATSPSVCQNCGNGTVEGNEACDGGGNTSNGCSATCTVQPNYTCVNNVCYRCGDGVRDTAAGETCDDGNNVGGDGCSLACRQETGWNCLTGSGGAFVVCTRCGDGVVQSAGGMGETCDDQNTTAGDGCNACQVESGAGWQCYTRDVNGVSVFDGCANCGNNIIETREQCDDGDAMPGDGCGATCQTEGGWTCAGTPSVCQTCGNGVREGTETCDDGQMTPTSGDGCSATCATETFWTCTGSPSTCTRCGNSELEGSEMCDDGNNVSNDGCSRLCAVESGWVCLRQPNGTTHQVCTRCGDRKVEGNEQCDDGGTVSNDGCSSTCQEEPGFQCHVVGFPCAQCGNGMLELGEQCDDGQMAPTSGDGCTDRCQAEAGYDCRAIGSPCTFCGDGVVEGFETCDDFTHCANGANCTVGGAACLDGSSCIPRSGDGCSASCVTEPGNVCDPMTGICSAAQCGDGIRAGTEECDNGVNATTGLPESGDGCSIICRVEPGWVCAAGVCRQTVCGDGAVEGDEACDDGNTAGSPGTPDGCSADCRSVDSGYGCPTPGALCTTAACGNGVLDGGEECDTAWPGASGRCVGCKLQNGAYCNPATMTCVDETCGNGIVLGNEACDLGAQNGVLNSGCENDCTVTPLFVCEDDGMGGSACDPIVQFVEVLTWNVSNVSPNALFFDPELRAFVGYKSTGAKPIELCLDGTVRENGTGAGLNQRRTFPASGSSLDGATYNPFNNTVVFVQGGNSSSIQVVPLATTQQTGVGLNFSVAITANLRKENGTTAVRNASAIAITDGGDLYVVSSDDQRVYVYPRQNGTTTGFGNGATLTASFSFASGAASSNSNPDVAFVIPGADLFASAFTASGDQLVHFYDTTGGAATVLPEFASSDIPGILFPNGSPSMLSGPLDGSEAGFDGGSFVLCATNPSEPCRLYARTCETNADCQAVVPGTVCVDDGPGGVPLPYCFAPAQARDDSYAISTSGPTTSNLTVLANDVRSAGTCRDNTVRIQSLDALGNTALQSRIAISADGQTVVFTKPAVCGSAEVFEYTALLGGGETDTARVTVLTECVCGDGVTQANEQCDPMDPAFPGARCNANCTLNVQCGDTFVDPGEECEPPSPGNGCTVNCLLESVCGDGVTEGVEECDDGNTGNGDGCSSLCRDEFCGDGAVNNVNEECEPPSAGQCDGFCMFLPVCGDANQEGSEACDDGGRCNNGAFCAVGLTTCGDMSTCLPRAGDGCNASCIVEFCGDGVLQVAIGEECELGDANCEDCRLNVCGDGTTTGTEECDDGDMMSGDGCSATCEIEFCGDSLTNNNTEQCDDGNTDALDACNNSCVLNVCGDGIVNNGEDCDAGASNGSPTSPCDGMCVRHFCGDDVVDNSAPNLGEECDPPGSMAGPAVCTFDCRIGNFCGDGDVGGTEQCDDGGTMGGDGCSATCRLEVCGNGVMDPGEACDDNNVLNGDGCSATCQVESLCGNGVINGGEQCDDANNMSGDGCSATCTNEWVCGDGDLDPGEVCDPADPNTMTESTTGAVCTNGCFYPPVCGDGNTDDGEQCDDGGTLSNDGCSATCVLEVCGDGTVQSGIGEDCEPPGMGNCDGTCHSLVFCGNGVIEPGNPVTPEQCDDGGTLSNDGCSATCQSEFCGDGIVQTGLGEDCDPADPVTMSGCDMNCNLTQVCGNGIQEGTETCDAGSANGTSGQPCTSGCVLRECGDGTVDADLGETCDPPLTNICNTMCRFIFG